MIILSRFSILNSQYLVQYASLSCHLSYIIWNEWKHRSLRENRKENKSKVDDSKERPVPRIGRWIRLSQSKLGSGGKKWATAPNLLVPLPGGWTSRSQNKARENQGIPLPRSLDVEMPREGMAHRQPDVKIAENTSLLSLSYFCFASPFKSQPSLLCFESCSFLHCEIWTLINPKSVWYIIVALWNNRKWNVDVQWKLSDDICISRNVTEILLC